jgi:hypothetical protein
VIASSPNRFDGTMDVAGILFFWASAIALASDIAFATFLFSFYLFGFVISIICLGIHSIAEKKYGAILVALFGLTVPLAALIYREFVV